MFLDTVSSQVVVVVVVILTCSLRGSVVKMDEEGTEGKQKGTVPESEDSSAGECLFFSTRRILNVIFKSASADTQRLFTFFSFLPFQS